MLTIDRSVIPLVP